MTWRIKKETFANGKMLFTVERQCRDHSGDSYWDGVHHTHYLADARDYINERTLVKTEYVPI
jgi:hypothetical protein